MLREHKSIEDLRPINSKCVRCSLCKFPPLVTVESAQFSSACPSYHEYKIHSQSGGGRVVMALSLGEGRAEISDEARDAFFQCTLCGACDVACKYSSDIEILEMLYALRAESFRRVGPLPGHRTILERLDEVGHPRPERGAKGDWLREMGREAGAEGRETLLFVGDHYGLCPGARKSLENLVHLLEAAGVAFGVLGDEEPSTARVALDIGDLERFNRHAEAATRALRDNGAATVICVDPHDLNAFRAHIPKVADLDGIRFVHAVEFLDELVKVKGQLVIYDPPRPVNRGTAGCYEPPRRLLRTIPELELVEFHRRREGAFCCGGAEVVEAGGYGDLVARTAAHRMEEARAVGAELVATACPRCETNLGNAPGGNPIPVRNVIDLLAESLGV